MTQQSGGQAMKRIKSTIFVSIALSVLASTIILPIIAPLIRELHLSVSEGGWMISIRAPSPLR